MFSWTDYFSNENNEILTEKEDVKVLKKSHLCQNINESIYTNNNCNEKRNMYALKKDIKKVQMHDKPITNNKNKCSNMKPCSKILDLSPEEKEKIAALIRELGVLQSEKERVSCELNAERNKFQLELKSMERMYKTTLADKDKLEEELRKKDEAFKSLNMEELEKSRNNNRKMDFNDEFVIVPKSSLKDLEQCSIVSKPKERYVHGPPKSSRSQIMTSDLLRTHSLQSVEKYSDTDRCSLIEEQKQLLVEKQYLNLVLKQQKCLKKLKNKIAKLEHNSKHSNVPAEHYVNSSGGSSIITNSRDLVTPRTLNNGSLDDDALSQSMSMSTLSNSPIVEVPHSPIQLPIDTDECTIDSLILKKDDLLFITALNHGIKDLNPNLPSLPRPHSGLSSIRTHSPSDSLFQIIDCLDHLQAPNLNNESNFKRSPLEICPEDDILNDLFFNL